MAKTTTPEASTMIFATLRMAKNGNLNLQPLSKQTLAIPQGTSKLLELDSRLPVKLYDNAGVVIPIGTLKVGDVIAVLPQDVTAFGTYTKMTNPKILLRLDGSRHESIPLADSSVHREYDKYVELVGDSAEPEDAPPPVAPTNTYYKRLVKRLEVPTLQDDSFYVDKEIWYYLVRNIRKNKPTIITGPSGSGKTEMVALACKKLKKELHVIDMSGMTDPIAGLIGVHRLGEKGSYFDFSRFSQVIQDENNVVLLDELNRAALESSNILLPVTDSRRQLYCDVASKEVPRIIEVKAAILATANIGFEYVGVNNIDRALLDRLSMIEVTTLIPEHEIPLLVNRVGISEVLAKQIVVVIDEIRSLYKKNQLSTFVSTRYSLELAELVKDGWDLIDAFRIIIYPLFEGVVTEDGERSTVHNIIKKYCEL